MTTAQERLQARREVMESALAAYRERVAQGLMTETEYELERQMWEEALVRISERDK